jgi:hypothetical protein
MYQLSFNSFFSKKRNATKKKTMNYIDMWVMNPHSAARMPVIKNNVRPLTTKTTLKLWSNPTNKDTIPTTNKTPPTIPIPVIKKRCKRASFNSEHPIIAYQILFRIYYLRLI